jgi:hypothetical protein
MSNEDRMNFGLVLDPPAAAEPAPIVREAGLNFGSANPRPPEPAPEAAPESPADASGDVAAPEHGDLPG